MTTPQVRVINAGLVAAELAALAKATGDASALIVRKHAQLLLTEIRRNASGRPGPKAPTGDYRRSWNNQYIVRTGFHSAITGTNAVQGMRLEYGFVGTDSLGRQL